MRPLTKYFCRQINSRINGRLAIRVAAIMSFQRICWNPFIYAMPTESVFISGLLVRINANIYSFQEVMKA